MKKYILTAISAAMLCGLCSCGDKVTSESAGQKPTESVTEAVLTTEAATDAEAVSTAEATTEAATTTAVQPASAPEGADLTAFHTDEYGAVVFDKPVEEQNEATLKAAAKVLWESAGNVEYACSLYRDRDWNNTIKANDAIYALIKDESAKSIDDVKARYHTLFSDKYPYDSRIDTEYVEHDGRVYFDINAGQRGYNIEYADSEVASYDGRDGNEMHFTVHDNYDATKLGGEAYTKNNEFTMVLGDDGTWRIGKFTLPY